MRKYDTDEQEIDFDVIFLLTTLLLLVLGTVMVYSSSFFVSKEIFGSGIIMTKKHIFHVIIGTIVMLGIMSIDYRRLKSKPVLVLAICAGLVSLCLCFVPGIGITGGHAKRWVRIAGFTFQASELMKIVLILFMANFLSKKTRNVQDFKTGVLPVLIVIAVTGLLIFIEPDFGTAATIGLWSLIILFIAGMQWRHLLGIAAVAVPLAAGMMWMAPYRRARLTAFIDPWADMHGIGYQIIQSMVAFAKGGLFGSGLGEGTQKLFFLPAPHTDFILSAVGEELGLFGVLVVIALFAVWIWRGFQIARGTNDSFGFYLVIASVTLVGLQAILNMGVAMSVLPTTGLALPFFSYGGSTLVTTMVISGLILSVSRSARL